VTRDIPVEGALCSFGKAEEPGLAKNFAVVVFPRDLTIDDLCCLIQT